MFESIMIALQEVAHAAAGGDWGYAELGRLLGNDGLARSIVNGVARVFGH